MSHKVKVQLGGAADATIHDFSEQVLIYDKEGQPAIHGGGQVDDGSASVGEFVLYDDVQAIEIPYGTTAVTTGALQLASRNPFWWIEDSPGYDSWLSAGWIDLKDIGRFGHPVADERVFRASWQDMNAELRGIPLLADHTRPEETDVERVQWVIDTFYSGNKRPSTTIIAATDHLIGTGTDSAAITMPSKKYEAGSAAVEIIEDCASTAGKIFGVVRHDTDSATHKCLLYIGSQDYDTYTTAAKISDELADWDPTDATAPVFEPHWMQEAAVSEDPTNMVSGIVSRWSGGVVNYVSDALRDIYNYFVESYSDDQSTTEAQATARASAMTLARSPEHITHMPSVLISPSQHPLLREGMSIQIKSRAAMGGQYAGTYRTRRIAKVNYEPAGSWNGEPIMWAHLELDRPEWRVPANSGKPIIPQPPSEGTPEACPTPLTGVVNYNDLYWDHDDATYAPTSGSSLNTPSGCLTEWRYSAAVTVDSFTLKQCLLATYFGQPAQKNAASGWVLYGSNDAVNYTPVYTRAHATWQTVETVTFAPATFRYWSLVPTFAAWGDAGGGGDAANSWMIHTLELCQSGTAADDPPPASDDDTGSIGTVGDGCYATCDHKHPAQAASVTLITDTHNYYTSTNTDGALDEAAVVLADHETRIDALEAAPPGTGVDLDDGTTTALAVTTLHLDGGTLVEDAVGEATYTPPTSSGSLPASGEQRDLLGNSALGVPAWIHGPFRPEAYGCAMDGATDDLAPFNALIADLVAAGGGTIKLEAEQDIYLSTTPSGLSVPFEVVGAGKASFDGTEFGSRITIASGAADLFAVTAKTGTFAEIALACAASTPTAGAAVHPQGTSAAQKIDFHDMSIHGFYDGLDIQVGAEWVARNIYFIGQARYGSRVRNTVNVDAGDWLIEGCRWYAQTRHATSALRIESSGGGKIVGFKINTGQDSHYYTNGIDLASSATTAILIADAGSIENMATGGYGFKAVTTGGSWRGIHLTSLEFGMWANSATPILLDSSAGGTLAQVVIDNITALGSRAVYVVNLDTIDHATIGAIEHDGYTGILSQTSSTNITQIGSGGGASALDDLTDVTITTPATGDLVQYDGSSWVNVSRAEIIKAAGRWEPVTLNTGGTDPEFVYLDGDIVVKWVDA